MVDICVRRLAENIATEKGLTDVKIEVKLGTKKGDGFTGDIFTVSVKNDKKDLQMIFKCAITDKQITSQYNIKEMYDNELRFYTAIIPALKNFETETGIKHPFTAFAKYLGSHYDKDIKIIAMEDLGTKGFEHVSKKATLDGDHVAKVLTQYGKFHAFSFAYRQQRLEEFTALVKPLVNVWSTFAQKEFPLCLINNIIKSVFATGLGSKVNEKFEKYLNVGQLFLDSTLYHGKYSAILHGDCWTNNLMFKYKNVDGERLLADMCFLDWQFCSVGTPVFDLSHFMYSSSSKEVFDNLDYYLRVYHDSFSVALREMGGDPEIVFPFSALKTDWKQYCKFGFILGLMLQRVNLIEDDEVSDFHDIKDDIVEEASSKVLKSSFDKEIFEERARNLVFHMYEIDAL